LTTITFLKSKKLTKKMTAKMFTQDKNRVKNLTYKFLTTPLSLFYFLQSWSNKRWNFLFKKKKYSRSHVHV